LVIKFSDFQSSIVSCRSRRSLTPALAGAKRSFAAVPAIGSFRVGRIEVWGISFRFSLAFAMVKEAAAALGVAKYIHKYTMHLSEFRGDIKPGSWASADIRE
jgi:hypothetical protein